MPKFIRRLWSRWQTRTRWAWADCTYYTTPFCCAMYSGPDASEQGPCCADLHNDWVAEKWYRRWVAHIRGTWEELKKGT